MSARNSQENKRKRRAQRTLRKGRVATKIDLIHYIKLRTNCTTGMAKKVLLSGAVRIGSHKVGYVTHSNGKRFIQPLVSSDHRDEIVFVEPETS